jgi:hypothetical protein
MTRFLPGPDNKKPLSETGLQEVLVKGKLCQLPAPVACFQELKPLLV